ncbi:VOC family protein [Streptomyces sp. WAC06614]|uniref:VOC family protein n=1 Tax=Streptomyces sp. WAC06614 TaxID=2487416 RepID=UPI000F796403|nr:VOC family protein [Streptomyces sp. WAC06614]RSS61790.1 VOC family protein [Streptomyces sp. WAC06614]
MALDLFAGIPVSDYASALAWYERLLGDAPAFFPNDTEAVWELGEHRYVYIAVRPDRAGRAMQTVVVGDLDDRVARIAGRGLEPAMRERYPEGMHKVTYRDPDGNEFAFGGLSS